MFNRNKKPKKKPIQTKYASNVRKRRFKLFFSNIRIPDFLKTQKALIVFIFIIIAILLGVGAFVLLRSDTFKVKQIEVIADNSQVAPDIKNLLEKYVGTSILVVNPNTVYSEIRQNFPDVENVFVTKDINGTIKVEIIQNLPVYYVVNFSGIYILDHNAKVLEVFNDNKLLINDFEQKVLQGQATSSDEYVKEQYLAKIQSADDRAKVNWDQIPQNVKDKTFSDIVNDLNNRVSSYLNKGLDFLKQPKYKSLTGYLEYLSNNYNKGDVLNKAKLNFIAVIGDFFRNKNKSIRSAKWLSDYTLEVTLSENRDILFTLKRDIQDQFRDLETLMFHGEFERFGHIDVRSVDFSTR